MNLLFPHYCSNGRLRFAQLSVEGVLRKRLRILVGRQVLNFLLDWGKRAPRLPRNRYRQCEKSVALESFEVLVNILIVMYEGLFVAIQYNFILDSLKDFPVFPRYFSFRSVGVHQNRPSSGLVHHHSLLNYPGWDLA